MGTSRLLPLLRSMTRSLDDPDSSLARSPDSQLRQNLSNNSVQCRQPGRDILPQMHSQRSSIPLAQHLEIAPCLCSFYYSKRELLAGHLQIGCVVAGDLQEHSRIGTAFVCLSGRMQEARTKAEAGGRLLAIANRLARSLQSLLVGLIHLNVG